MPRPSAKKLAALARRERVAAGYLRGQTQSALAVAEGVDQGTVSRDLAAVREEWKSRAAEAFAERVAEELARIDGLERTAWEGWERSCKDAQTRHVRTEGAGDAKKTISEMTTRGQAGDPRFLERVGWCVEQRLRLIGGYAPAKVAPTTPDGQTPYGGAGGDDTDKLLDAILAVLADHPEAFGPPPDPAGGDPTPAADPPG
jgi:hypothetical protein